MLKPAAGAGLAARRPRLTLAAALLVGVLVMILLREAPLDGQLVTRTPVIARVLDDRASPRIGARAPDVIVVVFTDYQCPVCKRTDIALDRLVSDDPGVQVIYKDWPILGPASVEAAQVALAARMQGRYVATHRGLMAHGGRLDSAAIRKVAEQAGVDWTRLDADRRANAKVIETMLARNGGQAWSLGLAGSPGYLVGPYLIQGGLDDRALRRAVARARKAGPPA